MLLLRDGGFRDFSPNSTVEFGRGADSIVERVEADPALHTRPLGKAPGLKKVAGEPAA